MLSFCGPAFSKSPPELFKDDPDVPWEIAADQVNYDSESKAYMAKGNVVIVKGNKKLTADAVHFNQKEMTAKALGHVVMTTGEDVIAGESLELDLENETGVLHHGSVLIAETNFRIKGDRIEKTGKDTYRSEKASFTTCRGNSPDWKITARNIEVTIEGYGTARHAALWAKKVPVVYTPYLFFPVKVERQTGFLAPEFGVSDKKGFYYTQPFFWEINDSSDATFFGNFMERRGFRTGVEYRYILDDVSRGTLMADGFEDDKIDDGTGDGQWGYAGDGYLRTNKDRYWFRMKHDHALPGQFKARLDLDIVSDQDYLKDFEKGYAGFEKTRSYFEKTFNRSIDPFETTTRVNKLNVGRVFSNFSLNMDLLWNDDIIQRRDLDGDDKDETLQKLPYIQFTGGKQKIRESLFYYDLDSSYTYFYRKDGQKGQRLDIYPHIYLPLRFKNYFSLEPSAGVRETVWRTDTEPEGEEEKQLMNRELYDLNLDLSTELIKIFNVPWIKAVDKIKHHVRPRIVYGYIPDLDQSNYPEFDEVDRIDAENLITYSLTNTFTSRSTKSLPGSDKTKRVYNEFCRIYLEQSYDINKERDKDPEPFSDIYGELDLTFNPYLSMDSDAKWTTYDSRFTSHNVKLSIQDKRGDVLRAEHRYETNISESINVVLEVAVLSSLRVRLNYEEDLFSEKEITKGIGFLYTTGCWSLDVKYDVEDDRKNEELSVLVTLHGLGALGI